MPKKTKSRVHRRMSQPVSEMSSTPTPKTAQSKPHTPKQSMAKPNAANSEENSQPDAVTTLSKQNEDDSVAAVMARFCGRRKAFTRFVMTSGIKAGIVRAIVALYEDQVKPDNALEYIRCFLGGELPTINDIKTQQAALKELRSRITQLEENNDKMKLEIEELELKASAKAEDPEAFEEDEEEREESPEQEQEKVKDDFAFDSCVTSNLSFAFTW